MVLIILPLPFSEKMLLLKKSSSYEKEKFTPSGKLE